MNNELYPTPEQAVQQVREAAALTPAGIEALALERLYILLDYAREHSPYLKEKYKDLPPRPALTDIPPMTRAEMSARFEDWVCDRDVTLDGAKRFIADMDNATKLYLDKYRVLATSGTTGDPLIMLRDARHNTVNAALMQCRLNNGAKLRGVGDIFTPGLRFCSVTTSDGYHSAYLSALRTQKAYEAAGMGERVLHLDIGMDTAKMVEALNMFAPETLAGYPSTMQILAFEQQAGRLHIAPKAIVCSAENLTPETMRFIESVFHCPVMDNYCSTEGGEAAMLCEAGHMHLNSDWILMEPVQSDCSPTPPGEVSDGVLLTNLANLVQPIIRYYVSDRMVLHTEPCPCGLPFPYMEAEGRKEDILSFPTGDGACVQIPPMAFKTYSLRVPGCQSAQFIQRADDELEIRFRADPTVPRADVGAGLLAGTEDLLRANGAAGVAVRLCDEAPLVGKSGKQRMTMRAPRES